MAGWGFIYWLAHRCRNHECFLLSEYAVFGPGPIVFLCDFHTRQAKEISEEVGLHLPIMPVAERRPGEKHDA